MKDIILGNKLLEQVCKKMGINFDVTRRVVIDIPYGDVVKVYVEELGTSALLDVNYAPDGIHIEKVGVHEA